MLITLVLIAIFLSLRCWFILSQFSVELVSNFSETAICIARNVTL